MMTMNAMNEPPRCMDRTAQQIVPASELQPGVDVVENNGVTHRVRAVERLRGRIVLHFDTYRTVRCSPRDRVAVHRPS